MTDTVENVITIEATTEFVTEVVAEEVVTLDTIEVAEPELVVETQTLAEVLEAYATEIISETVPQVETITETGAQGPPGAQGPSGALAQSLQYPAGEALGGSRAVYLAGDGSFWYADNQDASAIAVAGITSGAVSLGETATAQYAGEMVEPSWSWTPEQPVYLGASGQLTQTPPPSGTVVELGVALTATKMLVRIQISLLLE